MRRAPVYVWLQNVVQQWRAAGAATGCHIPQTPNHDPTLPLQVVEFLRWSVKHEVPQAAGGYGAISVNAQSLARRLLERLVHPQPYQRCAALRRSLTP